MAELLYPNDAIVADAHVLGHSALFAVVPAVIVIVTRAGAGGGGGGVARLVRTEVRMDISLDVDWVGTGSSPELLVHTM
ncbi:hypothetical protein SAMN05216281_1341 [Cryobacterium luteum]|nr:hypothetical protein SAMN05216281_1341 [Cryobacterium luteum]